MLLCVVDLSITGIPSLHWASGIHLSCDVDLTTVTSQFSATPLQIHASSLDQLALSWSLVKPISYPHLYLAHRFP